MGTGLDSQEPIRVPAEWEQQATTWVAWPYLAVEWGPQLAGAQAEWLALCRALGSVRALVPDTEALEQVEAALELQAARVHEAAYGDAWVRDTAPVFYIDGDGELGATAFAFNGWGDKYRMPGDETVAENVADLARTPLQRSELVVEGGALEHDGQGTLLTTRNCLLNKNRNPGVAPETIESALREHLGASRTIWLEGALLNDHTDGHIDTLARFIQPGVVVCMEARERFDPNREALLNLRRALEGKRDAKGDPIELVVVPSPGTVQSQQGELLPASYCNFCFTNERVIVPAYGSRWDDAAAMILESVAHDREVVTLSAKALLHGGGAFHCVTAHQPAAAKEASTSGSPGNARTESGEEDTKR